MLLGEAEGAEGVAVLAVLAELAEEGGGGALGGGGGVVELVGEVAGEFAEGGEFFCLLLHAGDFADAIEQGGDAALRHGGDGLEHGGEERLMDGEGPAFADGDAVATVRLHAREGELAGHLAGAADEEGDGAGVAAADLDLTAEDELEAIAGSALKEDDGTVFADELIAVGGEPGVLLVGEAIERRDGTQGLDDLGDGCGAGRRRDEELGRAGKQFGIGGEISLGSDLAPPVVAWAWRRWW